MRGGSGNTQSAPPHDAWAPVAAASAAVNPGGSASPSLSVTISCAPRPADSHAFPASSTAAKRSAGCDDPPTHTYGAEDESST